MKFTTSKPPCCILLLQVCIWALRACNVSIGVNKRRAIGYSTISSWLHLAAESRRHLIAAAFLVSALLSSFL
ncbi:hypothetical protein SVAN01_04510 [Stagonosporopsis vannaccii]|nr:hypothetical protein SVAN01_04510 [Stagonosporopsis vannaccii]